MFRIGCILEYAQVYPWFGEGMKAIVAYFEISRHVSEVHKASMAMRYMWSEMLSFTNEWAK